MKKSIGVILACALILTLGLVAWTQVAANDNDITKVTGGGWFISDDFNGSTPGHHCSFGFQAQKKGTDWSGRGSFMDRDHRLKAILTITDQDPYLADSEVMYFEGTARVYIDNKYDDEYDFVLWVADASPDRVHFMSDLCSLHGILGSGLGGGQITFH